MTGRMLGYCILKIPDTPAEPITGFAGETGRPVCFFINEDKGRLIARGIDAFPFFFKKAKD
jgi:hypothetical protein